MVRETARASRVESRIQLCGRFVVRLRGVRIEDRLPGRQGRLLFAYLTVRPSRSATRSELVDALWGGTLPAAPEAALSALLSKLRRALGEATVEGRGEIALRLPSDAVVDLETAVDSIHRAEGLIASERWLEAAAPTLAAYSISAREFLPGEGAPWIDELRRDLEEVHVRAIECYTRIGLAVRGAEVPVAAQSARRLIELAPYRESGYCLLMEALERQGNEAEALRVYDQLRTRLREELGTVPSADAQRIHSRLVAGS